MEGTLLVRSIWLLEYSNSMLTGPGCGLTPTPTPDTAWAFGTIANPAKAVRLTGGAGVCATAAAAESPSIISDASTRPVSACMSDLQVPDSLRATSGGGRDGSLRKL